MQIRFRRHLKNGLLAKPRHDYPIFTKPDLLAAVMVILVGIYSPSILANDKPDWIMSPERSGYISVVGSAPKQISGDIDAQRRVALMKARQQLGQIVRVRVEHTLQQEQQEKNGKFIQSVDSSTRLSSQATLNLNHAKVSAQWIDPENGDLYLLLTLPEESLSQPP